MATPLRKWTPPLPATRQTPLGGCGLLIPSHSICDRMLMGLVLYRHCCELMGTTAMSCQKDGVPRHSWGRWLLIVAILNTSLERMQYQPLLLEVMLMQSNPLILDPEVCSVHHQFSQLRYKEMQTPKYSSNIWMFHVISLSLTYWSSELAQ